MRERDLSLDGKSQFEESLIIENEESNWRLNDKDITVADDDYNDDDELNDESPEPHHGVHEQIEEYEEEEDEAVEGDEEDSGPSSPEKEGEGEHSSRHGHTRSVYKKIQGIVPKDVETKKEMMSFIAYPQHLEASCKLLSCSKAINFTETNHDKNRIFVSGTSIMSTKLHVSLAQSRKLCDELNQ